MARNLTTGEYVGEDGWLRTSTKGTEHLCATAAAPLKLHSQEACAFLVFMGPNGEVGRLDWEAGKLTFRGDMAESACIFFETSLGPLVEAAARAIVEDEEWKYFIDPNL